MPENANDLSEFDVWLDECFDELVRRNKAVSERFDLKSYKKWNSSQTTGQLTFSNGGAPLVVADAQFIGSYSNVAKTWKWGWANETVLPQFSQAILRVKQYGIERGFEILSESDALECYEADAWALSGAALTILNGEGVYRSSSDERLSFLLMWNVRRV